MMKIQLLYLITPQPIQNIGKKITYFQHILTQKNRKIVAYFGYKDREDVVFGHGTHVVSFQFNNYFLYFFSKCGTVAGEAMATTKNSTAFNGVAFKSKIAFFDVGTGFTSVSFQLENST